MNTQELQKLLQRHLPIHTGVFAADQLPKIYPKPAAFVFNNQPSTHKGEHWIAVYVNLNGHVEYFDSYGLPPPNTFKNFFVHTKKWTFNDKVLQSPFSDVCGEHCISFLIHRYNGVSMKNYVKRFNHDLINNDRRVSSFIRFYR